MRKILVSLIFFSFSLSAEAQEVENVVLNILDQPTGKTPAATALDVAKNFLDRPYVAATLEKTPEHLVCNLEAFDCYTLVENVAALTLTKHNPEPSFNHYLNFLQTLRYRGGVINGYADRMHYFVEWAHQAVDNSFLTNVGKDIGQPYDKTINFMTKNRKLYTALATDDKNFAEIKLAESNLNKQSFFYVPKEKFKSIEHAIKDGDIVAFTSSFNGLDVNHEGFAIWQDGKLYLLHASTEYKKVVISDETMAEYLNRIKKHTGVMIFRLTN